MDVRWVPNALTLLRAALVFPFFAAFAQDGLAAAVAAIAIALELTDLLDGWLARRLGATSELGQLLDPAADAFSRLALLIALATRPAPDGGAPWLPGWVLVPMLLRDVGVSLVRQAAAARGRVVGARTSGKIKAWVQGVGIWLILSFHLEATWRNVVDPGRRSAALVAGCVVAGFMALTLVDYVVGNRDALSDATRARTGSSTHDAPSEEGA